MAYSRYNSMTDVHFIADTIEDMKSIPFASMGDTCLVIAERVTYMCNSKGEWIAPGQAVIPPTGGSTEDNTGVDLSDYLTKAEHEARVAPIEQTVALHENQIYRNEENLNGIDQNLVRLNERIDSNLMRLDERINNCITDERLAEKPFTKITNDIGEHYLDIQASDGITPIQKMEEAGPGFYTMYVQRNTLGIPEHAVEIDSSLRGFCFVDTYNHGTTEYWYGYIVLFDMESNCYAQYIWRGIPQGWKRLSGDEVVNKWNPV